MSLWTFALSWELWLPWSLIPLGRVVTFPGVLIHPERGETRFSPPPSVVKPGFHLTGRGDGRTTCATGSRQDTISNSSTSTGRQRGSCRPDPARPSAKCETPGRNETRFSAPSSEMKTGFHYAGGGLARGVLGEVRLARAVS